MDTSKPNTSHIVVASLGFILTSLMLYAVSLPFTGSATSLGYWLGVFVLISTVMALLGAVFLFSDKRGVWLGFAGWSALMVLIFFPWHWLQLICAFIMGLSFWQASRLTSQLRRERLQFNFRRTAKGGIQVILLALVLVASLNIYLSIWSKLTTNPQSFYHNIAQTIVKSGEPVLQATINGFSPNETLNQFLQRASGEGAEGEVGPGAFQRPNDPALEIQRQEFAKQFGVSVTGEEQMVDVLTTVVRVRLESVFAPIEQWVPFIYTLLIFLSLRFFVPLAEWAAVLLGSLLIKIALRLGIVKLTEETVTIEKLELS